MNAAFVRPVSLAVLLSLGTFAPQTAVAGKAQAWDNVSTGLALGLGGAAVATTLSKSDKTGFRQGLETAGVTFLAVEALKSVVHETRPDGSNNRGFPSGHTALAFAAATYFDIRYGQEYSSYVPLMYGAAALTGLARIEAKKHYAQDVLAGAAIGFASARIFTTPFANQLTLAPTDGGLSLSYTKKF
ncbi:hypothetical protein U879_04465 [Defluviimonas sp. 20V17]|uniref:PAP2 superfamily protein n=1 Tax=Allgaiera indica TaxID=765699 RepID=A0AAN4UNI9_9RHOB|nr:phosphatase PAP2 family protein [Allgaiera indica]KDB04869.1 hypothetical protein U879_04465 [Defluviimonas sp. 20V17]GHD99054.1 phospholipid phosphatase [Allgaiera indica]SDW01225.1 PAP2 superfamily protein [Allgaiera indica]